MSKTKTTPAKLEPFLLDSTLPASRHDLEHVEKQYKTNEKVIMRGSLIEQQFKTHNLGSFRRTNKNKVEGKFETSNRTRLSNKEFNNALKKE